MVHKDEYKLLNWPGSIDISQSGIKIQNNIHACKSLYSVHVQASPQDNDIFKNPVYRQNDIILNVLEH